MTGIVVVLACIVGVVFGAMLVGLVVFFWRLMKLVSAMENTMGQLIKGLEPLIKSGAFVNLANASTVIARDLSRVFVAITNTNRALKLFNKAFFKEGAIEEEEETAAPETAPSAAGYAPEGSSGVFSYDETEHARLEKEGQLRIIGIETNEKVVGEPGPEKIFRVNA